MTHASHHLTLADIARQLGVTVSGNAQQPIRGLATLKEAQPDQVAFLANRAYLKDLATTKAAAVLLHPEHGKHCPVARLEIDNPYLGYAKLSQLFDPLPARDVVGIHPTAVVAEDAQIGTGVCVQAHAVIEAGAVLGDRVVIGAGSVVGPTALSVKQRGCTPMSLSAMGWWWVSESSCKAAVSSVVTGLVSPMTVLDGIKLPSWGRGARR